MLGLKLTMLVKGAPGNKYPMSYVPKKADKLNLSLSGNKYCAIEQGYCCTFSVTLPWDWCQQYRVNIGSGNDFVSWEFVFQFWVIFRKPVNWSHICFGGLMVSVSQSHVIRMRISIARSSFALPAGLWNLCHLFWMWAHQRLTFFP